MKKESIILISEPHPHLTLLTLNRPEKRNALNPEIVKEFKLALTKIAQDKNSHALMIRASGEHFCAGADISWMQKIAGASQEENVADAEQLADLFYTLYHFPKPTMVVVQGMTMGGGLGLISCCDIAIASENAGFTFSEVKIGLTPGVISPYILAAIGERATRYYFLTAEKFNAHDAKRIGLIHHVIPDDDIDLFATQLSQKLLKHSPSALSEIKNLISKVSKENISKELSRYTAEQLARMRSQPDAQEGLKAFLEKREAKWST